MPKKNMLLLGALAAIYAALEPKERRGIGRFATRFLPADMMPGGGRSLGLAHRLPKDAMDVIETTVMPVVRERLGRLGLSAEVMAFNLPHIPVARLTNMPSHREVAALARPGAALSVTAKSTHIMRDSAEADAGWRLSLDVLGAVFMVGNYAAMAGKPHAAPVPMRALPLVFSTTPISPAARQDLLALAGEVDRLIGGALDIRLPDLSVVEFGPAGNAVREFYRLDLSDGRVWDVTTGRQL